MSRPPAHLHRLSIQQAHNKLKQRNTSHAIPTDYRDVEMTGIRFAMHLKPWKKNRLRTWHTSPHQTPPSSWNLSAGCGRLKEQ